MKKLTSALFLAAAFLSTSFAFAADQTPVKNGYTTSKHAPAMTMAKAKSKSLTVPATDITIANGSVDYIYVMVPNTSVDDMLYPMENDHLTHPTYTGMTQLVLQDRYSNTFFNSYVCRYAVINVYGQPGSYRVNIDSEYCY